MTKIPATTPFATGPVSALALTADGTQVAAICDHNSVHFANPTVPTASTPLVLSALPNHLSAPSLTALTYPHCSALYTVDSRGALSRYDASTLETAIPTRTFSIPAAHSGAELTAVAAISSTSSVLTAAKEGSIRVWDPASRQTIAKLTGHRYDVRDLAVAQSHDLEAVTIVASAGRDRTVRLWDVRVNGESGSLHVFEGHTGWVHSVALADGDMPAIISCSGDKTVRVWDLRTMRQRAVYSGHQYRIWSVAVATDAGFAASGSTDATVRIWPISDTSSEQPVTLEAHRDSVLSLATRRDGSLLLSACEDGTVLSWRGTSRLGGNIEDTLLTFEEPQDSGSTYERSAVVPKQLDTTPLVAETAFITDASLNDEFDSDKKDGIPLTSTSDTNKISKTPSLSSHVEDLVIGGPEQDPRFDKSAAELMHALTRIRELENSLHEAEDRALNEKRLVESLKAEVSRRDDQISKLQQQVEASKRLADAVEVHTLLAKNARKMDLEIDYREPVNKIGAVSDELSKLAARLDAMITTS